jgi:UDP-GlcNAc:undecaprenyl-phosphate GlcNAc-1-phosphate transferase
VREYLLTFFVAASVTYLCVGLAGRLSRWTGAALPPRDRDVHSAPVPRLGGVAMLAGVCAAMLVASYLPRMNAVFEESSDAQGLLAAAVVICLLGVADDIWEISAPTKLAGQIAAAGLLVVNGVQLTWLQLPNTTLTFGPDLGTFLTIFLVVAVINAVNFIDGLDGLAAGALGIGAAAFFTYAYLLTVEENFQRLTTPALVAVIVMGVCVGFLPHNVDPAKIFMGDSGAMLLGLLLASASITLTGKFPNEDVDSAGFLPFLLPLILPLAVIMLPFVDITMAVVRRTWAGRAPWAPDKQHLHHRLLEIGHSKRRAVVIMWTWAGVVSFGVVLVAIVNTPAAYIGLAAALLAAIALTVFRRRPVTENAH